MTSTPTQTEIQLALDELKDAFICPYQNIGCDDCGNLIDLIKIHKSIIRYCLQAMADPMWQHLPKELTAENGAKAALMGEFSVPLSEKDQDGNEYFRRINVPWTTIKEIHKAVGKLFTPIYAAPKEGG